jgi:hypothetical protein
MANSEQTIEVWDDSLSSERPCNGATCREKLVWAEVVKSGRKMCFTAPAVPLRTRTDEQTGRLIAVMSFGDNHWSTCPDSKGFKRGNRS